MEILIESSLRVYQASILLAGGAWILAIGLRREVRAIRLSAADPAKSLALMQAFRVAIIGLCMAALGLAWLTQTFWLAILALVVGGEETFESTMAIGAISPRSGRRA